MIEYPNELDNIFDKLDKYTIKPIIIGGYIRDYLLHKTSKDIDIELYGISSLDLLQNILEEFGSVNNVGKSFGVCKLSLKNWEIDFSLPRRDSKVKDGHKGFEVQTDVNLDFKTATSRRDFTINAIGYDVKSKKILDPFNGQEDLKNSLLRAVDLEKFDEDPLRVLRAVQFSSRFNLSLEKKLHQKCEEMMQKSVLNELPKERIFDEIKKLLLKSKKPSLGILLLKDIQGFLYFEEFSSLSEIEFKTILSALDNVKASTTLMLAIICTYFSQENRTSFLEKMTNEVTLIKNILTLLNTSIDLNNITNYEIYKLATQVNIEEFLCYKNAMDLGNNIHAIENIRSKAIKLNVYNNKLKPLLQGKDIINLGLKPSKEFSTILNAAYEAQMRDEFTTYEDALTWLNKRF